MPFITTPDGVDISYKDWGAGQPVVLSHGWPLNADSWEAQQLHLADNGFRAIAHDRRGHGRSAQVSDGNDMDHCADDLAALIEALDLRDVILVGFSTGGGEVTRYIGRHGTGRVAKLVLVSAVPPFMLKTDDNPGGEARDRLVDGLHAASDVRRSAPHGDHRCAGDRCEEQVARRALTNATQARAPVLLFRPATYASRPPSSSLRCCRGPRWPSCRHARPGGRCRD